MNQFQENIADTAERTLSERHMEVVRQQGGMFVEAVRVTRMPMLVTDAGLPGNPIIFANRAFLDITRRYDAEDKLRALTSELEGRVAARTRELEAANDKLEATNERLSRIVSEREMLLREVNHRAKNSLAVAASLLAIQGRRQPDRAVRALFEEAQDRLNAMARVHDLLSKSESAQNVDLADYVTDLCEALRPITEDDGRVGFKVIADNGILVEADTAFALGIVLTELVTNAVKYAFPPPRPGKIVAQARRGDPGRLEVSIKDDGIGMASFREGSLGYGLVRSLVEQISATIAVQSDPGLAVTISFPDTIGQPTALLEVGSSLQSSPQSGWKGR